MSTSQFPPANGDESSDEQTVDEKEVSSELAAQVDVLAAENQRLREAYSHAQRTQHRRTALALIGVGVLAALGAVGFPDSRMVLFALSGTGVFSGVLTYFLTPERFIPANVADSVYTAVTDNGTAIVDELGLQDTHIYLPTAEAATDSPARLYVPQHTEYEVPERAALNSVFVITDEESSRGIALYPTGGALFREFERAISGEIQRDAELLGTQLIDGLTDQFELVERAKIEQDASDEQLSIGISGIMYGSTDQFDHPAVSFLGVGFAVGLEQPITVETTLGDDRADVLVTVAWAKPTDTADQSDTS